MMAVFWFAEHRARFERQFLARYYNRLIEYGVQGYTWDACWHDYRFAIIGYLTYPAWQWSNGIPDFIWWHHLERLAQAFQDLDCAELL